MKNNILLSYGFLFQFNSTEKPSPCIIPCQPANKTPPDHPCHFYAILKGTNSSVGSPCLAFNDGHWNLPPMSISFNSTGGLSPCVPCVQGDATAKM